MGMAWGIGRERLNELRLGIAYLVGVLLFTTRCSGFGGIGLNRCCDVAYMSSFVVMRGLELNAIS